MRKSRLTNEPEGAAHKRTLDEYENVLAKLFEDYDYDSDPERVRNEWLWRGKTPDPRSFAEQQKLNPYRQAFRATMRTGLKLRRNAREGGAETRKRLGEERAKILPQLRAEVDRIKRLHPTWSRHAVARCVAPTLGISYKSIIRWILSPRKPPQSSS